MQKDKQEVKLDRYSDLSDKQLVLKGFEQEDMKLIDKLQVLISIAKAQEADDIAEYIRGIEIKGNDSEVFKAKMMLQTLAKSIQDKWVS